MMNPDHRTLEKIDRRTFLGSLATTAVTLSAGCGDSNGSGSNISTESPTDNGNSIEREKIDSEVENLNSIFRRLSKAPVVDEGKFVFDVKQFEDEFDQELLLEKAEETQDRLDSMGGADIQASKARELESIANTARLLVQQRIILHQVITAGLTCEQRFYELEIDLATEVINNARQFLIDLDATGEQIGETLNERSSLNSRVDGYDPAGIMRTQEILVDIILWTNPAYEGILWVMNGMKQFVEGNSALEDELFEKAELKYRDSNTHFEKARESFESANNQGSRLPYMSPFVEELRCILPAYVSSSEQLSEAMGHFNAGEEAQGKEVAKEGIKSADRITPRCL